MSSDNDLDMVPVPEANGANADDVLLNVELPLAELLMQAGYYLQEQVECDGIDTIAGEVEVDVGDGEQTEEKMHDVEEKEHESPLDQWKKLPATAVVLVYSYLDMNDRFSMCLSTKAWCCLLHDGSLWRRQSFRFGGYSSKVKKETTRMRKIAKKHSKHLRDVNISVDSMTYSKLKPVQSALQYFFKELGGKGRLLSLQMKGLRLRRQWEPPLRVVNGVRKQGLHVNSPREKLIQTLCNFFRHAYNLRYVDLSDAQMSVNGNCVLTALAHGARHTLEALKMQDLFVRKAQIYAMHESRLGAPMFTNLRLLYTNYNYINESIMLKLADNSGHSLERINIKVDRIEPHSHLISNLAWCKIKKKARKLKIYMMLDCIGNYKQIKRILPNSVPLYYLDIYADNHQEDEDLQFGDMICYLADNFYSTLETLRIVMSPGQEHVDEPLLRMLPRMRRLTSFIFNGLLNVKTVARVLQLTREFKIGLVRLHLSLDQLDLDEVEALGEVLQANEDVYEGRGLDYRIEANDTAFL